MTENKKPPAAKTLPFKHKVTDGKEHSYATPMETSTTNKRERGNTTPTNTPENTHMERKAKGTSPEGATNTQVETILEALENVWTTAWSK